MSMQHPQNGPSFSRSTKKAKPLTDAELASIQAWKKARDEGAVKAALDAKAARARSKAEGDTLIVRGWDRD